MYYRRLKFCIIYLALNRAYFEVVLMKNTPRTLGVNNPALLELRGPPHLGTPIPPSNPRILNTHKEIFIQNDITLFLDVW
jgi:hypothetical protein